MLYMTNLKVTIVPGMAFTHAVKGIRARMVKKSRKLSLQSTEQVPFFASLEVLSVLATQAQLE